MAETDPEQSAPHADQAPSGENAHQSAFTAEASPQSSANEPDPFNELENLYAENAGLKDKVLRTLAEMENLRRRTEKEVGDAKSYAISAFARDMLTFADNLERALASLTEDAKESLPASFKSFIEGIEVTQRDFISSLGRRGIRKLEPLGQKFDPNFHEALFEVPNATVAPGTVIQVVEAGYQIGDRVLRPAKVGVARAETK